jgi:hypothetical protein
MTNNKLILNLKFSFLITILSLVIFTSCDGCGSAAQNKRKGKGDKSTEGKARNSLAGLKKVIVLIHGLKSRDDHGIADLKSRLGVSFKNSEIVILKRDNSDSAPTTQQAEEAYINLKQKLEVKNLVGIPTCLIGDSHGGLVALELYRQHKNDLNIVGIITNHSPLEGAPGINVSDANVTTFKSTLKNLLTGISKLPYKLSLDTEKLSKKVDALQLKEILTSSIQQPVIDDLTEGSPLLNNVARTLSSIDIPVLTLTGHADILTNLIALLGFASQDQTAGEDLITLRNQLRAIQQKIPSLLLESALKPLEVDFGKLIGDQKNDSFVPLYSQCASHIVKSSTVKNLNWINYHHFYGMTTDQKVYKEIVNFINKAAGTKK